MKIEKFLKQDKNTQVEFVAHLRRNAKNKKLKHMTKVVLNSRATILELLIK